MPEQKHTSKTTTVHSGALCPHAHKCGACPLIEVPYNKQLQQKQQELEVLFNEAGLLQPETIVNPVLGMNEPWHYRNKVISPFAPGKPIKNSANSLHRQRSATRYDARNNSRKSAKTKQKAGSKLSSCFTIQTGMYAPGTHRLVNTDGCMVENEQANQIVQAIRTIMPRHRVVPYNEDTGQGFLRHVIVRVGHSSNEVLVTLVTNSEDFPGAKSFCRDLVARCPFITSIVQNINTRMTNVILGDGKERTLYGPGFILDELCGLRFRISAHSFYQVNAVQTEVLYRRAIELAQLSGTERIMDAYCGTGTIGLAAAKMTPGNVALIGVDDVAAAIRDAQNNARHNGIDNAHFVAQDAGEYMNKLARSGQSIDVLFMDPPRSGASEAFLQATCTLQPRRIVYISCNPKTQVRDLAYLAKHSYQCTELQAVDMFPHTKHLESIAVLKNTHTK